jgi:hypothetical protein
MNNHSSDIIFTAIGVREVNQVVANCLQATFLTEFFEQIFAAHHFPEAIGTKEQCITWA